MPRVSRRVAAIGESPTLAVDAKAKALQAQGESVINFGAGEPDFPTPELIKAAAHRAIDANFTKYTPNAGIADLRRAICDRYRTDYGVEYAESEVIFGPLTEYTGLRFALFLLAEYAGIVVFAALTVVLFLGGWRAGPLPESLGWLWTLLKTFVLAFVVIWIRVSYPRLREDQLQRLAWQLLVPVALAQLVLTGVVRVVSQ